MLLLLYMISNSMKKECYLWIEDNHKTNFFKKKTNVEW
jgi:hypothetical protein